MNASRPSCSGIVQGLTEFLPISSTAHLRIVPAFFGWDDPGAAFTAVVQLGTMAAVLLYFRARPVADRGRAWLRSLRDRALARGDLDARMGWYIILGTIPIAVLGLAFKDPIENEFRTLELIGDGADRLRLRDAAPAEARQHAATATLERDHARATARHRLRAGARAGPGRRALGRDDLRRPVPAASTAPPRRATRSCCRVPAVVLSGLFELRDVGDGGGAGGGDRRIATLLAFVVGYASIALLLRFLARHTIGVFVGYRVVVGVLVIVLAAAGTIS